MHVLLHIIAKELLQLRRDKKMIPMIFLAPAIQLLALGYAANRDVTDVPPSSSIRTAPRRAGP